MYVSPVHAVMIFHNVETNEEIWDYKATDDDLLRVVKDNLVGEGGIEAKKAAAEEREREWEQLLRDRCVLGRAAAAGCVVLVVFRETEQRLFESCSCAVQAAVESSRPFTERCM